MNMGPGVGAVCGAAGINTSFDVAIKGWYLFLELRVAFTKFCITLGEP